MRMNHSTTIVDLNTIAGAFPGELKIISRTSDSSFGQFLCRSDLGGEAATSGHQKTKGGASSGDNSAQR